MKKLKIYLDTSIISHLFQEDAPEQMSYSLKLWEHIKENRYEVFISELVLLEIGRCSEAKKEIISKYLNMIEYEEITIDQEIEALANKYIFENIIPIKYKDDAIHIAAASIYGCNAVVSWNFKHMVKYKTIIGVNGVNKFMGYNEIQILSPNILIEEEE